MNDGVYNRCIKMASLACENVKRDLASVNHIQNANSIRIKVRSKETLADYIEKMMKSSQNAMAIYRSRIQSLLVIESDDKRLKNISDAGEYFIKSIMRSRDARVCQKYLIDLLAAELYCKDAFSYDKRCPYKQVSESAMEMAKNVVSRKYPLNFMDNFDFSGEPHIKEDILENLRKQAFNRRYAFGTFEASVDIAAKKYEKEYLARRDFFTENRKDKPKKVFQSLKDRAFTPESLIIADLYRGAFAHLPAQNKVRRFVNLKARNRDIEICPPKNLSMKRQFATIDAMTMHRYIYDFYTDNKPSDIQGKDIDIYYFRQELAMYRHMWGETANVTYRNGRIVFGDGSSVELPSDVSPYEGLHRVNAAYGALFGFTPDDMKGDWLYDSVRQAYTSEGMAEYRLAMIEAKLKGKL